MIAVDDHDVLSGRGVHIADHPGNKRFRLLIANGANQLAVTPKKDVAEEIIRQIQDRGGRFLKRPGKRGLKGPWEELTKKEVQKKTCQALQDCSRLKGYADGIEMPSNDAVVAHKIPGINPQSLGSAVTNSAQNGKDRFLYHQSSPLLKAKEKKDDDMGLSITNNKSKIIIHKSSRYKNHEPNIKYFYCCRLVSANRNTDRSALAKNVIELMEKKGLSFWLDDDELGLRKMTNDERWRAVKKKIANDKFHSSIQRETKTQQKIAQSTICHNKHQNELIHHPSRIEMTREREMMALQAMISLGQS